MQSSMARLNTLESLHSARVGVGNTWSSIFMPSRIMRTGAVVGGGLLGLWMLRRLLRGKPAPVVQASAASTGRSSLMYLLVQLLMMIAFPMLRSRLSVTNWDGIFKRFQPSYLFFRWLGLEK